MTTRSAGRGRMAVAVFASLLTMLATNPAAAAELDRDAIYAALKVDRVPADYVVLIDTSGSMAQDNLYGGVRSTLRFFLNGLTPTDHVAIYTFADSPTPRYIGPAGDPARILATVPGAPGTGQTDIGAAIDRGIAELERPHAASIASIVLITDGKIDAPAGSRYGPGSPAWRALRSRAMRLPARSLVGYSLPLRGATGAALLTSVIPRTETLSPASIPQLREYLDRSKARTRIDKARVALAPDLGKGVTASWDVPRQADLSAADVPVTLTLRSTAAHVPLRVTDLRAGATGGPALTGDLPTRVDLAPGTRRTFRLTLAWHRTAGRIPFRDRAAVDPRLTVAGAVSSPWAPALSPDLPLHTPAAITGSAAPAMTVTSSVGTWYGQGAGGLGALLLLTTLLLARYLRVRAPQSGTLIATEPGSGRELGRFTLAGRNTRVRGQQLPGTGSVRARRVRQHRDNTEGIEYVITYRRAAHTATSSLPPQGTVLISGVTFAHSPN